MGSNFFITIFVFLLIASPNVLQSRSKKVKALFIGNSYTAIINIPNITNQLAKFGMDTLDYEVVAPGGFTLSRHLQNPQTLQAIQKGGWDFVVLQEQSQIPSFPQADIESMLIPAAITLDSIVKAYNKCAQTFLYMTWGRKNGDTDNCPNFPPVCSYSGMDSLIRLRYLQLSKIMKAIVAPVGAVWRDLRTNQPNIELYQSDGSHPSDYGAYAAACTFYSTMFQADVSSISYNYKIDSISAVSIRQSVKKVVFDSLSFWLEYHYQPKAGFTSQVNATQVQFKNLSVNGEKFEWDFGDAQTSIETNPTHTYAQPGKYEVTLKVSHCELVDITKRMIPIGLTSVESKIEPKARMKKATLSFKK